MNVEEVHLLYNLEEVHLLYNSATFSALSFSVF